MRPRFLVPVHGELPMQEAQARIAVARSGLDRGAVRILENGDVLELDRDHAEVVDHVSSRVVLADADGLPLPISTWPSPATPCWPGSTPSSRSRRGATTAPTACRSSARSRCERVAVAVSSSLDVFERAGAEGAQLLVVHHGLFWDGASPVVRALGRRRLETLFRHDLTLAAYHLPLDAHPVLGNNAGLMEVLGIARARAVRRGPRPLHRPPGRAAGAARRRRGGGAARRTRSAPRRSCSARASARCGAVGAISGAAGREVHGAAAAGLDCFVTGEPEEDLPYLAPELGVHVDRRRPPRHGDAGRARRRARPWSGSSA